MGKRKNKREIVPKETVLRKLKETIESLSEIIPIQSAYLFGSYAKGSPKPYSDVDVAVISPNFGRDYIHETIFLMDVFHGTGLMVEPHVFTCEEYSAATKGTFLYNEVMQKGIPLMQAK